MGIQHHPQLKVSLGSWLQCKHQSHCNTQSGGTPSSSGALSGFIETSHPYPIDLQLSHRLNTETFYRWVNYTFY